MNKKLMPLLLCLLCSQAFAASVTQKKITKSNKVSKYQEQQDILALNAKNKSETSSISNSSLKNVARANTPFQNEISTNFSSGEWLSQKACSVCNSNTSINAQLSYLHYLQDKIQVGGEGGLTYTTNTTLFNLMAVGAYNFDADFKNSFYGKAGLGLVSYASADGNNSKTQLGFFAGAGKRFSWLNNVTYSPEIRLIKKGDLDISFQATFLNFSIYWN